MKISVVLMIVCLQVSSAGTGIAQTVSLSEDKVSLKKIFAEINRQTGYEFLYTSETLAQASLISIDVKDAPLEEVLSICFKGQPLTYVISDKTIVVKASDPPVISVPEEVAVIKVTGTVRDKEGAPMPAVNVIVKGTTTGTSADSKGHYEIQAEENDVLVFSFIGYKTQEQQVGARILIDVVLEEDITSLREVTISGGYYESTDKLKTGSIVKVTAKDLENRPVTSPLMSLQGRVPGLEITPTSGAPGVAPTIRIRGLNSLRQINKGVGRSAGEVGQGVGLSEDGNYPLYVIDGVQISSVPVTSPTGSFTAGGYDPLSTIDLNSIESIEVLKDGDATAIYGSRGANGVILITTKKGSKFSDRTNINIASYFGVGQVSRHLDLLGTKDYIAMRREAIKNNGTVPGEYALDLLKWDTTRYTDWQKVLIGGTANISDLQATVSSGNKNTSFRFSGSYHKETTVFPGDFGFSRFSGQLSIDHLSNDKKFRVSVSSINGFTKSHLFSDSRLVDAALSLAPNAPKVFNPDGTLNWELHDFNGLVNRSTWDNPFSYFKKELDNSTYNSIANVVLSYELFPGLSLAVNSGFTYLNNQEHNIVPKSSQSPNVQADLSGGSGWFNSNKRISWIVEPKVSYFKQLGEHRIDGVLGLTMQESTSSITQIVGTNYTSDALLGSLKGAQTITISDDRSAQNKYASIYARLGYNWREKYILNLTGRRDGSSRFGTGNRFGNFGAIGAAWLFSSEDFFKRLTPFINLAKLRVSYGITGSDNIGDYNFYNLYRILDSSVGAIVPIAPDALYNPSYGWEITKKLEGAFEMGILDNRLGLEINWYLNRSSNQLVNYSLSGVTGFESVLSNFDATIQNTGWETILRADVLDLNSWHWNVALNFSIPRNVLVRFDGIENSPYYATLYKVGEPLSVRLLYVWKGVNKETGLYEFEDRNQDGTITPLDRKLTNSTGKPFYGGFTSSLRYKTFDLSLLIQFAHRTAIGFMPDIPGRMGVNQPTYVLNRWQKDGDNTDVQKFTIGADSDSYRAFYNAQESNHNIQDASFIRLKTLSIGYRLPSELLEKIRLMDVRLFVEAQNLFTLTPYKGLDPETGNTLPPLQMVTVGLQLKL